MMDTQVQRLFREFARSDAEVIAHYVMANKVGRDGYCAMTFWNVQSLLRRFDGAQSPEDTLEAIADDPVYRARLEQVYEKTPGVLKAIDLMIADPDFKDSVKNHYDILTPSLPSTTGTMSQLPRA